MIVINTFDRDKCVYIYFTSSYKKIEKYKKSSYFKIKN